MPYHYSRARKQFIAEQGAIRTALGDAYSAKCSSSVVREFALCSAVVLTRAKVETYLATLVADWGRAVSGAGLKTDALHPHTRAFLLNEPAIEKAYMRLAFDGNEGNFIPALGLLMGTPVFNFSKNGEGIPAFQVARVYSDVKYPTPKNLRKLFRRLGIDPVFPRLNAIAKRDVESLLTSFNDIRTEMSHHGMPVGVSVGDIKARINDVSFVVGYVDRLFYSHVCKTTGAACWIA
jgi:hypothetical protein